MSIFSILNDASNVKSSVERVLRSSNVQQAVGTVRQFLPDDVENQLTNTGGLLGQARNAIGLSPRVVKNTRSEFDIDRFRSEIAKTGYAQNNRFDVNVSIPDQIRNQGAEEQLRLRCFATSLPGKTLMIKDDIRRFGYGMIDKVPHATMFNDVTLMFIVDGRGELPTLFERWTKMIHNADLHDDNDSSIGDDAEETIHYLVNYKENYAGPLEISQYNSIYDRVFGVRLRNAFPIHVGEQQLAWDNNNSISVLPVTFTYTDFKQY